MALRALCSAAAVAMAGAQTSNWLTDHDYSLEDLNPASATYGEEVGPTYFPCVAALRELCCRPPAHTLRLIHRGKITMHYFGHQS